MNCRVKVNYQVVDPAIEAAQARLDAMRTGRYVAPKPKRRIQKKEEKEESMSSKFTLYDYFIYIIYMDCCAVVQYVDYIHRHING